MHSCGCGLAKPGKGDKSTVSELEGSAAQEVAASPVNASRVASASCAAASAFTVATTASAFTSAGSSLIALAACERRMLVC